MARAIADIFVLAKERGMTQRKMAAASGRTQGRISDLKRGRFRDSYVSSLVSLAAAVGAEIEITVRPKAQACCAEMARSGCAHTEACCWIDDE